MSRRFELTLTSKGNRVLKTSVSSLILLFSFVLVGCGNSQIETTPLGGAPENPLQLNRTPEATDMTTNSPPVKVRRLIKK